MKTVRPLGLYIHIPFCKAKCVYCDFYSLPHGEDRMDAYTDALCAHLTEAAPLAASHTVDTVYFGGGTPSYLGEKRLCKILKVIEKRYQVARDAEITLEANPDSAGDWKALRALRRCGFNRISLGMQSACDEELRTLSVWVCTSFSSPLSPSLVRLRDSSNPSVSRPVCFSFPASTLRSTS